MRRVGFDDLTPIYPNERLKLENNTSDYTMRNNGLAFSNRKGPRGMIVAPPKAGKNNYFEANC